jgi:hypothetical protein
MAWRKWIVRGIVYGIVAAAAAGALLYQRWTNPSAVREQVISSLHAALPGAHVSVDSARLRILGGIQLNGLRLSREDDPEKHEFLHIPSAIFYHDKEKILDGELRLRKVELVRPRLRIRRSRTGAWNLEGLARSLGDGPQSQMPAIVIHQGTLILEDRLDPTRPMLFEIADVSLTLVNDPATRVTIHGTANSDLLGKLQLDGLVDRSTNDVSLAFRASNIPLTQTLATKIPIQCPQDLFANLTVSGQAKVEGKVVYQPSQAQPIFYDVRCEIREGKLQHPALPLPMDRLQATLTCSNGELHLEKLSAWSGRTQIDARGMALLPCVDQEFAVDLNLQHVMLGKAFSDRLAEKLPKLRDLHEMFKPDGPTTIQIVCARHGGKWVEVSPDNPSRVLLKPENIAMAFRGFPYPLERTTGSVSYNLENQHVEFSLLAHAADDRPVEMKGHWNGDGDQADVKFFIKADDVPIDEKILHAFHTESLAMTGAFIESFNPAGRVDVKAYIERERGQEFRNEYRLFIHDAAIRWKKFPLALKNVSGYLNILPDQNWTFHDFQGMHQHGHIMLNGRSMPRIDDKGEKTFGVSMEITGRKLPLSSELHEALRHMPGLYKSWETFRPHGDLYFTASVERPGPDINELDVKVDVRGVNVNPTFFPYQIEDVSGLFHFHQNALDIAKVRARHANTFIALDRGRVDLHPRGGYYADLQDAEIRGLTIDEEFTQALPPKLQEAARRLNLRDPLKLRTRVVVYQPPETGTPFDVFWDGQVWMYGARFTTGLEFSNVTGTLGCVGRYNGRQIVGVDGNLLLEQATVFDQPFKKVQAKLQMRDTSPDVLLIGLHAPIYSGDVTGQVRVDFSSALRYELNLTASQINVAEFGRQNLGPKAQISGTASARLHLTGLGTGADTLDGNGSIDIPRGHLYNLPFLLDLLKFLGLHWPDRTAFEEFHSTFAIQGPRLSVQKFDLLGSGISLTGKGDFDLSSKQVHLDIYPMWGRVEQLLPSSIRPWPTNVSKNLLTVEVRGKATDNPKDLRFVMKPMPIIVDPLLLVRDRMLGKGGANEPHGANVGVSLPVTNAREPVRPGWLRWD